jgi:hypothetical protein
MDHEQGTGSIFLMPIIVYGSLWNVQTEYTLMLLIFSAEMSQTEEVT